MLDRTPGTVGQIPAAWLTEAAEAAYAVFDRTLKLMAPNRVFVDEAVAAVAAVLIGKLADRDNRLTTAADRAGHLNEPMLTRLRTCAADTSLDWDQKITIFPSEAAALVEIIDLLTVVPDPTRPDADDQPTPLVDRHQLLRRALVDVVCAAGLHLDPGDRLRAIKDRAVTALAADQP